MQEMDGSFGVLFQPGSQTPVWEPAFAKLRFAHPGDSRETEFRGRAFPNRSLGTRRRGEWTDRAAAYSFSVVAAQIRARMSAHAVRGELPE